jgi:hypothetical protein
MATFGTIYLERNAPARRTIGGIPFDCTGRKAELRIYRGGARTAPLRIALPLTAPSDPATWAIEWTAAEAGDTGKSYAEFQVFEQDGTPVKDGQWHGFVVVAGPDP